MTDCQCQECQNMCAGRPCWGTPAEIQKIIDAGYGRKLMQDYWINFDDGDTFIISPAIKGYEQSHAPFWPQGCCVFFKNGLCQLHDAGLKPLEGRLALCKGRTPENLHEDVAKTWNTAEGKHVVAYWEINFERNR